MAGRAAGIPGGSAENGMYWAWEELVIDRLSATTGPWNLTELPWV